MTSYFDSDSSTTKHPPGARVSGWLKLGLIASASAFAGGLAAAWWYRKTLKTLSQTDEMSQYPQFGIPFDDSRDEG